MGKTMSIEKQINEAASLAIREAILKAFTNYNSPLNKLCETVVSNRIEDLTIMANEAFNDIITSEFKQVFKDTLSQKIGKLMIEKIGGELEKRVNELRADPITRAKMTLAITEAIKTL
jgi:hypothetical protein